MGRAPCCDKSAVKKGPWSLEEDAVLKSHIEKHGTGGNWIALPQKIGLKRCGKSCRLRWLNYLRPNIKHGGFTEEEDYIICSLYMTIGSRWSVIASQLPGRTDNDIKNYWNTRLKKKLLGQQGKTFQQARRQQCRFNFKPETAMMKRSIQTHHRIHTESRVLPHNLQDLDQTLHNKPNLESFSMEEQATQGLEPPTKNPIQTFSWEPNEVCIEDDASFHCYGNNNFMSMVSSSSPSLNSMSSCTNSFLQASHYNINDDQEILTGFENFPAELLDEMIERRNDASNTVPRSTLGDQSENWDNISSIFDYPYDHEIFS